ncbi:uncharacterized protein JCM6883_005426 [Sporobolomyces salmoneus]|uniref:uncharacterized protein n=1 Tax=Sporobolomyces salmoneus TaxID=183962 RepID=UPI00317B06F4
MSKPPAVTKPSTSTTTVNQSSAKPSTLKQSTTSTSSFSLSGLKSFKRNKTVKPAKPQPRRSLSYIKVTEDQAAEYPSNWSSSIPRFEKLSSTSKGGPVRRRRVVGSSGGDGEETENEAPWSEWLKFGIQLYAESQTKSKGKGKQKELIELDGDDEEILVGEQSWESPSDRSATPTNPPFSPPLPSTQQLGSPPPPAPPNPSTSRTTSTTRYPSHALIPHSRCSTWSILHIGGITSSLSDLSIYSLLSPSSHPPQYPSLPVPIALKISRRPGSAAQDGQSKIPVFLAYDSESKAQQAQVDLKTIFRLKGLKSNAKGSDKKAGEMKWFGSEMGENWEELLLLQTRKRKEEEEKRRVEEEKLREEKRLLKEEEGKRKAQEEIRRLTQEIERDETKEEKRKRKLNSIAETVLPPALRSSALLDKDTNRRPPARPPPPPPAPSAQSIDSIPSQQALVEQLLFQLQRAAEPTPELSGRSCAVYNPDLDPRKRRKLK